VPLAVVLHRSPLTRCVQVKSEGTHPFKLSPLRITVEAAARSDWREFQAYHYKEEYPSTSSTYYKILVEEPWDNCLVVMVGMIVVSHHVGPTGAGGEGKKIMHETRLVVHPDWQGLGTGSHVQQLVLTCGDVSCASDMFLR